MFTSYPPIVRFILALGISFMSLVLLFIIYFLIALPYFDVSFTQFFIRLADPSNSENIALLRSFLFGQTSIVFGIFPLVFLVILYGNPFKYINLDTKPKITNIGIVISIMILALPFINLLAEFNKLLIDNILGTENMMKASEQAAEKITKALLSDISYSGLFFNIIVVALLPAICEEIFFRGALFKVLSNYISNVHIAIIISGLVFSLFHWQFYGFIPRALMGILFGYLYIKSSTLWLPIIAHFINNSVAVIVYYYINKGIISEQFETFGAYSNSVFIALFCGIAVIGIFYSFFIRTHKN